MKPSRTARATSALMLAMVVSVWLSPSAHAQLGDGLTDAVDTVGGVTGIVEGDSGTAGNGGLVDSVADGLEGQSGSSADDGVGSGGPDLIGDLVEKVDGTVEKSKETITQTSQDTLGNAAGGTLGSVTGAVEGTVEKVGDKDAKKQTNGRTSGARGSRTGSGGAPQVLGNSFADAMASEAKRPKTVLASATETIAAPPGGTSLVEQIGRVAAEAVKQAAFPLALILLVTGFLMVQNRIDRKDPKLAFAPVDTEHDLLSFT